MQPSLAIKTETTDGKLITFRKDTIHTVIAKSYSNRNLGCFINGIEVKIGYNEILKELGWDNKYQLP